MVRSYNWKVLIFSCLQHLLTIFLWRLKLTICTRNFWALIIIFRISVASLRYLIFRWAIIFSSRFVCIYIFCNWFIVFFSRFVYIYASSDGSVIMFVPSPISLLFFLMGLFVSILFLVSLLFYFVGLFMFMPSPIDLLFFLMSLFISVSFLISLLFFLLGLFMFVLFSLSLFLCLYLLWLVCYFFWWIYLRFCLF